MGDVIELSKDSIEEEVAVAFSDLAFMAIDIGLPPQMICAAMCAGLARVTSHFPNSEDRQSIYTMANICVPKFSEKWAFENGHPDQPPVSKETH